MRARLVVGLVAGWAALCVAQPPAVELYVTRASEFQAVNAPHTFELAARDFRPHFNGFGGTPVSVIDTSGGEVTDILYLWGRFVNERPNTQVFFVDLRARTTGELDPLGATRDLDPISVSRVYRHWRNEAPVGQRWRRWNNPSPIDLHTPGANAALAVTADGIQFRPPSQPNGDLYDPATGTFLYGALRLTAYLGSVGALRTGLGLGLAARDDVHTTPDWVYWPEVRLNGRLLQPEWWAPHTERPPTYETDAIWVIPEPTTFVLLALAAAGLRRR